jgi:hypothetical protein
MILVVIILLVVFLIIWAVASARKSFNSGKGLVDEEAPISEKYATVQEKHIEKVMTGTYKMPGHYLAYMVRFRFDNGDETSIAVPQEIFDDIPIGSREILITQNGNFIDFGSLLGESLPDDDPDKN